MVYLILHFKVIVVIQRNLGQESRQEAGAEILEECCLLALFGLLSFLSHITQAHLPRHGTAHVGRVFLL